MRTVGEGRSLDYSALLPPLCGITYKRAAHASEQERENVRVDRELWFKG